ncbi:unnamed protein product [Rhizophagus irregularis]|nr:unnamed protein product [Rhizophagus irregularis]
MCDDFLYILILLNIIRGLPLKNFEHLLVEKKSLTKIFIETIEEALRNAVSYWAELKDKLVKKFELEHPELSTIFMKRTLIASGIPAINKRPSFILHSLPNISDNSGREGYLHEKMFIAPFNNVMENLWLCKNKNY